MGTQIIYNGEHVHCRIEDTLIYLVVTKSSREFYIGCAEMHWADTKDDLVYCINRVTHTWQRIHSRDRDWLYACQDQDRIQLSDNGLTIDFLKSDWEVAKQELLLSIDLVSKWLREKRANTTDTSKSSESIK